MTTGKILSGCLIIAAFGGGLYLGSGKTDQPAIHASEGIGYSGGFEQASTSGKQKVVVKKTAGKTHVINDGDLIMTAVKLAEPGDTLQIMPGTYHETVYIDKDDIRLIGVIKDGRRPILDGKGVLNDAILYSGNNIVIENLHITKFKGNGIMGQAGNNFEIRNNIIADTGVYGIFPQLGQNGIIEHNIISGIEDAAIYVGMSDNIHVAHNEVFNSVAGIEIENSRHAIVENNYVHDNTGGILAFITPGLPIKTTVDVIIRHNFVVNNNHKNFGSPGSMVSAIPAGTGILIVAADDVVIEDNIISNNKVAGILIMDHQSTKNTTSDPDSDPVPDNVMILNNLMINNGYDTISELRAYMLTQFSTGNPDIISVGENRNSCIINPSQYITAGLKDWTSCAFDNTDAIEDYLLDEPVAPREIDPSERGKVVYLGICTGCHSYDDRLIGPPIKTIQLIYQNDPQRLANWIAAPTKVRPNFPEMPPQNYLDPETRLAVAKYMLAAKNSTYFD